MAINLKELSKKEEKFVSGHRMCTGCGPAILMRQILLAVDTPVVIANATGCVEVSTAVYPYSSWKVSWMHSLFENTGAVAAGIETTYRALKKRGKIDDDWRFIAIGGDGGTYDIGFQALSGLMERRHRVLYICYDNNGYMNTGIQRSGATPMGAWTTTSCAGEAQSGKAHPRKDLTAIMAAHEVPYVAQAALGYWRDFMGKVQKALATDGPSFINVLGPCWRGWRFDQSQSVNIAKLAVQTRHWPLLEIVDGEWKLTYIPKENKPVEEYLKPQGRFAHLFKPGAEGLLKAWQEDTDERWERLLAKTGQS